MKKNILFLFVCIIALLNLGFSQNKAGSIKYKITYNWVKQISAVTYLSKKTKDHYNYVWGNRSEYTAYSKLVFDSTAYIYEDIENTEHSLYGYSWRKDEYYIYRNLLTQKTYDVIRFMNKLYVVEDSIAKQKWKILNDVREITGHICMNASWTDTIKMNTVIAWFALDIPLDFGPDRFCGLPGLILELDINNGAMVISAEKIEFKSSESVDLPKHKKRVRIIKESEYQELIKRQVDEAVKNDRPYFWSIRY
jgi:GLPGLI family protein